MHEQEQKAQGPLALDFVRREGNPRNKLVADNEYYKVTVERYNDYDESEARLYVNVHSKDSSFPSIIVTCSAYNSKLSVMVQPPECHGFVGTGRFMDMCRSNQRAGEFAEKLAVRLGKLRKEVLDPFNPLYLGK